MCSFVSYGKYLGFFCVVLNLRLICQLEFQWTLWYCYILQYLFGLRNRKESEVGSRKWSEVYCFLQPCQLLQISPDNILLHKILSFEGIIKGFLVKEVAIEGTQRNLTRHRLLLSSNFLSSLFLRTFPEKVSDPISRVVCTTDRVYAYNWPSIVHNRQSRAYNRHIQLTQ